MKKSLCNSTQIGEFIVDPAIANKTSSSIFTVAVHVNDPKPINYPIKRTGYYCINTWSDDEYKGVVEFRNAYGELSAAQIPKLAFYGGLAIAYALVLALVFALTIWVP